MFSQTKVQMLRIVLLNFARAPNDYFLSNAFKRCFRLSGVLLKLFWLILCGAKKKKCICSITLGELEYSHIY